MYAAGSDLRQYSQEPYFAEASHDQSFILSATVDAFAAQHAEEQSEFNHAGIRADRFVPAS
jgi:hypothetical protein